MSFNSQIEKVLKVFLWVFLGGGLGSLLRFAIGKNLNTDWAYGTFTANLVGCLFIGVLMGLYQREALSQNFMYFAAVGFCGGLTTFSTFAFELMEMLKNNAWKEFLLYSLLSVIFGFGLAFLGWKIVQ